ncbi:serine/threonine-protein kinase [Streptomyces sp. WMMC500]|uniref:protein kinase domain-containing protein n=1 Tax=Streptomyces sp. WMMC500 TaxID=3015154 RepID=UPI00248B2526|nr:serine/threonine-protein kinase [Streptomyces sp. WMMC500]WBB61497.1 serine/threonine-protein kinase [Streptomyces sp. WMMC500]
MGQLVGDRYRLEELIDDEGRGEVWFAADEQLGRRVVLKRGGAIAERPRLLGVARAQAKATHPHVVTLYGVEFIETGPDAGCWLVMEHVPGGSLDKQPRMAPERAARIGAQIASALGALHANGVVHCDVKPANVVITDDGTPKLTDFDSAQRTNSNETISPGRPLSYTPDYAAPEVVNGSPVPRSDVYSLAAMLYKAVTGVPHDEADGAHEGADGQAGGDSRDGRDSQEDDATLREWKVSQGVLRRERDTGPLAAPLEAMLRRRADRRPDAAEARRLLEEAAGQRSRARRLAFLAAPRRHPRAGIVAGTALVTVAALAGAWLWWPGGEPADTPDDSKPAAGSVIGDRRTMDPCSLTDPGEFTRFGRSAERDRDYGNFDRCDVLVYPQGEDGEHIDVQVEFDSGPAPESPAPVRTFGGIGVIEEPPEGDECARALVLPDEGDRDVSIWIYVDGGDARYSGGADTLCAMADVAARTASETLGKARAEGRTVPRRNPPAAEVSLLWLDACRLLDAQALEIVPGVDAGDPDVGFGNWDCDWYSTTRDIEVQLRYDRDQPLTGEDGTVTRLAGRDAVVSPQYDGEDTCTVRVEYREYPDENAQKAVELLYLTLEGDDESPDELCGMATRLAETAAGELPKV